MPQVTDKLYHIIFYRIGNISTNITRHHWYLSHIPTNEHMHILLNYIDIAKSKEVYYIFWIKGTCVEPDRCPCMYGMDYFDEGEEITVKCNKM
jgi:hypothetical protein